MVLPEYRPRPNVFEEQLYCIRPYHLSLYTSKINQRYIIVVTVTNSFRLTVR